MWYYKYKVCSWNKNCTKIEITHVCRGHWQFLFYEYLLRTLHFFPQLNFPLIELKLNFKINRVWSSQGRSHQSLVDYNYCVGLRELCNIYCLIWMLTSFSLWACSYRLAVFHNYNGGTTTKITHFGFVNNFVLYAPSEYVIINCLFWITSINPHLLRVLEFSKSQTLLCKMINWFFGTDLQVYNSAMAGRTRKSITKSFRTIDGMTNFGVLSPSVRVTIWWIDTSVSEATSEVG